MYVCIEIATRLESAFGRFFHKPRGASSCMEIEEVNAHEMGRNLHRSKQIKLVMHS